MKQLLKLLGLLLAALLLVPATAVLAAPDPDAVGSLESESVTALDFADFAAEYLDYDEDAYEDIDFEQLKVPYLEPDKGLYHEVNELIRDSILEMLEPFEDAESFFMMSSYEVFEMDDILSIRHRMNDMVGMSHDHTYVLDLDNEELLDNVGVADLFGIEEDEVESFILKTLYDASIVQGQRLPQEETQFNVASYFPGQTLSYYYDHPDSAELYVDKNGDLALSAYLFVPAGAGFTQSSLRVQFTLDEPSRFNPAFFKLDVYADLDDYTFDKLPGFIAATAEGFPEDEDFWGIDYNLCLIDQALNDRYEPVPPVLREYRPGMAEDQDPEDLNETFLCVVPPDRFTVLQLWDIENDVPYSPDPCAGTCFIAFSDFGDAGDEAFLNIGLRVTSADGDDIYPIHDPDTESPIQLVETDVNQLMLNLPQETESVVYSDFAEDCEAILEENGFDDMITEPEERYYNLPRFASDEGDFGDVNEELDALAENLLQAVEDACALAGDDHNVMEVMPQIFYSVYEDTYFVSLYLYVSHPGLEEDSYKLYTFDKEEETLLTDDEILDLFGQKPEDRLPILGFTLLNFGNEVGRVFGEEGGFVNYAHSVMAVGLTDLYNDYDPDNTYFYIAENGELRVHIPPQHEDLLMTYTMLPAYYELLASKMDNPQFLLLAEALGIDSADYDLIIANVGSFSYDDYDPKEPNAIFTDVNVLSDFIGSEMPLDVDHRALLADADPDSGDDMDIAGEGDYYIVIAKKLPSVLAYVAGDSGLDPETDIEDMSKTNLAGWYGTGVTRGLFIRRADDPDARLFWRYGDAMELIDVEDLPDNVYDMTDDLKDFPDTENTYDWVLEEFIKTALMKG